MRSTQDIPRLSWLNGKTHKSAVPNKGRSMHADEHAAALKADIVFEADALATFKKDDEIPQ